MISRIGRMSKCCKNWCAPTLVVFERPMPTIGSPLVLWFFLVIRHRYPTNEERHRASLPPERPVFQLPGKGAAQVRASWRSPPHVRPAWRSTSKCAQRRAQSPVGEKQFPRPTPRHSLNDCVVEQQFNSTHAPIVPLVHFGVSWPVPRNVLFSFAKGSLG